MAAITRLHKISNTDSESVLEKDKLGLSKASNLNIIGQKVNKVS